MSTVTALYLLEPTTPGAAWAPFAGVRPIAELRAGLWRIRERWEAALRPRRERDPRRPRRRVPRGGRAARPAGRSRRRPGDRGRSSFAPAGDRLPATARRAAAPARGVTVGWIVPAGERWDGPHDTGDRGRDRRASAPRRLRPDHRARAVSRPGLRRLRAAPSTGVPEGSLVLGDPADVDRARGRGRAGRGLRRAPRRRRARARRRGAARHPARGPAVRRPGHQAARRLHPRARCSARSAGCTARSRPASSSATPTRATTASSATAWSGTG